MANEKDDPIINLATSLLHTAMGCAEYFEKNCSCALDSERFGQVLREFLFVFVHFIDRYSFEIYGDLMRNRITDSLVYCLDQILHEDLGKFKATDHIGPNMTGIRGIDFESLSSRNIEYATFRSGKSSKEAEEAMNGLSSSFSAHLSQVVRGVPHDLTCRDLATNLFAYSLDKLDLETQLAQFRTTK